MDLLARLKGEIPGMTFQGNESDGPYTSPWSTIALATLMKPAMLAPLT